MAKYRCLFPLPPPLSLCLSIFINARRHSLLFVWKIRVVLVIEHQNKTLKTHLTSRIKAQTSTISRLVTCNRFPLHKALLTKKCGQYLMTILLDGMRKFVAA